MKICKLFNIVFLLLLACSATFAQKPAIKILNKLQGSMQEQVDIKGNNFGTDATKLSVYFGASKATIKTAQDQLLEVSVPAGTTFDNVSVTNTTSGLTGYSREQFLLDYNGTPGINVANLIPQINLQADNVLYDLATGDFDNDGDVDIITANKGANVMSIFSNNSTPGTISFSAKSTKLIGGNTLHIKAGDLNGDGKLDIVLSEDNSDRIFILQNTSAGSISFSAPTIIKLTGIKPVRIEIADLDLDGKPEIIFTDSNGTPSKVGRVCILQNQSTVGTIVMSSTSIDILLPGTLNTDGLAVQDLNDDHRPDIVTSQYNTSQSNLFIIENKSTPGNISYNVLPELKIGQTVKRIRIGDLDGDNKPDIAVTQLFGSSISIFLNNTASSSIVFGAATVIPTGVGPWGIDFGDLDGDGKADIVTASIINTNPSLTILNNTSTAGSVSFTKFTIATPSVNRHVAIGDLDNDGKPDVAYTSVDDATLGFSSKVSILKNVACMIPQVKPAGPFNICQNSNLGIKLFSTVSGGATYAWKDSATPVGTSSSFPVPDVTPGVFHYQATALTQAGGISCPTAISNVVDVTIGSGTAAPPVFIPAAGPGTVCVGSPLNLQVSPVAGLQYAWTGPNNYSGTGATPPPVTSFQIVNAGRYFLSVIAGSCVTQQASVLVDAIDAQGFEIQFSGSDITCTNKTLTVSPTIAGATYQWQEKTLGNVGTNMNTFNVTATGEYTVLVTTTCSAPVIPFVKITVVNPPTADFQIPPTACAGQNITFTNKSTTDPSTTAFYTWTFGDGNTSGDLNPVYKYTTSGGHSVGLSVSYNNGACQVAAPPQPISIQPAPVAMITNPDNTYALCNGQELTLQILGTFSSYLWSTGEQTPTIVVNKPGTYSVKVSTSTCSLDAEKAIDSIANPIVVITADPTEINEGQSSQFAASGLIDYTWSPADALSNLTIANPVAAPIKTTNYTVTGKDNNGCLGTGTIELKVRGEAIVNKLKPWNFFSPDGKNGNDTWSVEKILDYPQCNIAIYDDKGIKVFESKPYNNDWDGTFHGKKLPDGVYYYIIRCDGEENHPRTGSITLLR